MADLSVVTNRPVQGAVPLSNRTKWLPFWLLLPSILVLLALQVWPTVYSVYLSTTRVRAGVFQDVGLRNFERLLTSRTFHNSLLFTLEYTFFYVTFTVVLGMVIALLLNRRIKFTGWYLVVIFIPWVISDVVAGTMWRWLFQPSYGLLQSWINLYLPGIGLSDHLYTTAGGAQAIVILAAVWRGLAFTTLLSLGALQTVPSEIIESASLDGANRFQRFFRIIFPLVRPTLLVMILLVTIQSVNSVGLVYAITKGEPGGATRTAAFFLLQTGWEQGDFGLGSAASVTMFFINMILTLFYLRLMGRKAD
jgi:ABC-type sugar transport system permease subunit